ncbi:MAG TPA: hypothetical protein PKY81_10805 [bacterium]|mgnify:CR=1 FL=1|nr:hypothetical protein [bacterium]
MKPNKLKEIAIVTKNAKNLILFICVVNNEKIKEAAIDKKQIAKFKLIEFGIFII